MNRPKCKYGQCGGSLAVFTDEPKPYIACVLCARKPGAPGVHPSPQERASAEREAYIRRRQHHRAPFSKSER